MRYFLTYFILIIVAFDGNSQIKDKELILDLKRHYIRYLFQYEYKNENDDVNENVSNQSDSYVYIKDLITTLGASSNDSEIKHFIILPDTSVLKTFFIINELIQNPDRKESVDEELLLDSLLIKRDFDYYKLVDVYYKCAFTLIGNNPKSPILSIDNFDIGINDTNTTVKGIAFLRLSELFGKQIRGIFYLKPNPDIDQCLLMLEKFGTVNSMPYYYYDEFDFNDLEFEIYNNQGVKSYKSVFLNYYYRLLYAHLVCLLSSEDMRKEEAKELWVNSILSKKEFYQYTDLENEINSLSNLFEN